MSDNNIL